MDNADNPYASPLASAIAGFKSRGGLWRQEGCFQVGMREVHSIRFVLHWTGFEEYFVNEVQTVALTSWALWGTRELRIEGSEPHRVEIRMRIFPLWRCEAYVDGELYIEELCPTLRRVWLAMNVGIGLSFLALAAMATLLLVKYIGLL